MKQVFLHFIFFLFYFNGLAQIKGAYTGLFTQHHERFLMDTPGNFMKVEWDGEKKLLLQNNESFSLQYKERGEPCAARSSLRTCTGKYRINKDTLYLNSTYKQQDFYKVTEKKIDSIANGKIMIVTGYPNNKLSPGTFINEFLLKLNEKLIGEFEIKDTVYCNATDIENIFISCCSPHIMEWQYTPKNKNSNYFDFTLTREINYENIYLENCKLLIGKNKLVVLDSGYLEVKDNRYSKVPGR